MATIYYNTKTTNTIELTQEQFKKLPPKIKVKYRKATEAEQDLHKRREDKKKVAEKRRAAIEKAQEKEAKKETKSTPASPEDNGTSEGKAGE